MDFSKIDLGVAPKAKAVTAAPLTFDQFRNGAGQPLVLTVMPINAPEGEHELRKWRLKFGIGKQADSYMSATEEALDQLAKADRESNVELFARLTVAWNVQDDGAPVACTIENRKALFAAFPPVLDALAAEVTKAATELGNSPKP